MRLTELDEEAVKDHLLPVDFPFDVDGAMGKRRDGVEVDVDGDFPEIFVFECDGFESRGGPREGRFAGPDVSIFHPLLRMPILQSFDSPPIPFN